MEPEKKRTPLKWPALGLLLLTLVGLAPMISVLIAAAISDTLGCMVDEGSAHSCLVFGHDIGEQLYTMFVLGWLQLATWPLVVIAVIGWVVLAGVAISRAMRR